MSDIGEMPVLVLFPHNRCNCRCVMCDIWKIRQVRQITPDDLRPHLDSIRRLKVQWVVFSGGEPQLNRELGHLASMLKAEGVRVTVLTAGLLFESQAGDLVGWADDVIVSLDGPPDIHDRTRNVPNAFARLTKGIEALRDARAGFPISARTTVQKNNFRSLVETVRTAEALGLDSISFLAADLTSSAFNRAEPWSAEKQQGVALTGDELKEFEHHVERLITECSHEIATGFIRESPEKLQRLVLHFAAHLGLVAAEAPRCNAPWVSAVVEADGNVRPCFFHPPVGNIADAPLVDIVNGPAAKTFRGNLDVTRNPICRRCVCSLYVPVGTEASAIVATG